MDNLPPISPNNESYFTLLIREVMENLRMVLSKVETLRGEMVSRTEYDNLKNYVEKEMVPRAEHKAYWDATEKRFVIVEATQAHILAQVDVLKAKAIPWWVMGGIGSLITLLATAVFTLLGGEHTLLHK